jgi:hypothetical protein
MRPFISEQEFAGRSRGEIAAIIGHRLVEIELRGNGDLNGAITRLKNSTGIPFWTWKGWWAWQSRPQPKEVLDTTWERLMDAYQLLCMSRIVAFQCELDCARCLARLHRGKENGGSSRSVFCLDTGDRNSPSPHVAS